MAMLKDCPFCGGAHRKKTAAKACARSKGPRPKWSKKELGL